MLAFCFGSSALQLPLGLAVPDVDRAAARAARADRRRRLQVPDARLVQERPRQQRADRADVDDVVRVRVARRSAPSSAARTSDWSPRCLMPSAFDFEISCVKRTQREHRMQRSLSSTMRSDSSWNLVDVDLRLARDRRRAVVRVVVVLQRALAGLVADAAVDRVVERDELHRLLAVRPHELGVGEHAQALGHRHVAGDLDPAAALDLHDADAAVAGDRQLRVPAEVRDEDSRSRAPPPARSGCPRPAPAAR